MKIRDMMTRNPITVGPETQVMEAKRIMKEKKIRLLPVIKGGELVGTITHNDLLEAAPSPATSLSVYELNYLFLTMKVEDIMKNPLTLTPDTPLEEALKIRQEKKIGSFPVMDNGKLVGIVTETDMIRFLVQVLDLKTKDQGFKLAQQTIKAWKTLPA